MFACWTSQEDSFVGQKETNAFDIPVCNTEIMEVFKTSCCLAQLPRVLAEQAGGKMNPLASSSRLTWFTLMYCMMLPAINSVTADNDPFSVSS